MTGHQRFKELIAVDKAEYMASSKHAAKDEIAGRIYNKITAERGGKFLRKVDTVEERQQLGISNATTEVWVEVDKGVAMNKIKQTLREQQSSTSRVGKSSPLAAIKRKSSTTGSFSSAAQKKKSRTATAAAAPPEPPSDLSASARSGTAVAALLASGVASMPDLDPTTRAATSSSQSPLPSSADSDHQSDTEFRMKHPSLRKRDMLRKRREQQLAARRSGDGGGSGTASLASGASREQQPERLARAEGKSADDDDDDAATTSSSETSEEDDDDDRKPRAK